MSIAISLFKTITEPTEFFESKTLPKPTWVPISLFILLISMAFGAYFFTADPHLLAEQFTSSDPTLSQEEREMAQSFLNPSVLFVTSTLTSIIQVLLVSCLFAGYFFLLSNMGGSKASFSTWFNLTVWGMIPFVLDYFSMAINVFFNSGELLQISMLNPTSLNSLLLHLPMNHPLATLASSISIGLIWAIVHLSVAYSNYTDKSNAVSGAIVSAPVITLFGLWFLMAA